MSCLNSLQIKATYMFQLQFELGLTSIYSKQYYAYLNATKINMKRKEKFTHTI